LNQPSWAVQFLVPPWDLRQARVIGAISETAAIRDSYNISVLDWEKVAGAFLQIKARLGTLKDGEAIVGIRGGGAENGAAYGTYRLAVRAGAASCERVEAAEPDAVWDASLAAKLLFGPLPPAYTGEMPERLRALLESWLPLPLHWPEQDQV